MTTITLPETATKTINHYFALQLGEKSVPCPYFMNIHKAKDLRAMVGKGTPEEIEMEAKMWEKLKGVHFVDMSVAEIRQFLEDRGIGIDCSGFVMHTMNEWFLREEKTPIWGKMKIPNKSLWAKISYVLKPVQKLGAEIITNNENAMPIKIKDVLPGDVIRTKWKKKNSHHILLITSVTKDDQNNVTEIEYVNSTEQYGKDNGMRTGKFKIIDQKKSLEQQEWIDFDTDGTNHTYEGFLFHVKDNGIRRIKAVAALQEEYFKTNQKGTVKSK